MSETRPNNPLGTPASGPERPYGAETGLDAAAAGADPESPAEEASAAGSGGDRSAEEIRPDIEETREQLGDTVEALAEKTDVKARAQDEVQAVKQSVAENISSVRESVSQRADDLRGRAREATPESAQAGVHQLGAAVQRRPLPFATIGGFAAGALVGWLIGRR